MVNYRHLELCHHSTYNPRVSGSPIVATLAAESNILEIWEPMLVQIGPRWEPHFIRNKHMNECRP